MKIVRYLKQIALVAVCLSVCSAQTKPAAKTATTGTDPGLTGAISSAVLQQPDQSGDYIPCKFTEAQLNSLSNPEVAEVLTPADVEALISRVLGTVESQAKTQSDPFTERFVLILTGSRNDLIGKTASEALNTVLGMMAHAKADVKAPATSDDFLWEVGRLKSLAPGLTDQIVSAASTVRQMALPLSDVNDALAKVLEDKGVTNTAVIKALKTGEGLADTNAIVDAAQKSIARLIRPDDVGCAMSILSYAEASKAYGHVIAKEYIAIQVHVRNLNRTQEFVLHDAQFAVNADPNGRLGRYFSGRDKVIVRSLSAAQQTLDPRNLFVHSIQGIGTILAAVSPIYNGAVSVASGIYNGAFATSLDKYWKDESTDQLNLLNDTGFSSTMNSQTVVPKGGSSLTVIFVPSLPFTQGWWLLPCTGYIPVGSLDDKSNVKAQSFGAGAGVDVAKALEVCTSEITGIGDGKKIALSGGGFDLFALAPTMPYKKWSGNSMSIFQEISNVVVAGMHIVSDDQLQPSLTQLQCKPTDDSGNIQFTTPLADSISCTAMGKNLDKFAKLRLRNAADLSDTTTAEGAVTVTGDSSTATVAFQTTTLLGLPQPSYEVFGVSTNGVESKTGQYVHLSAAPLVTGYAPSPLDLTASPAPTTLTLNGYHLAKVTSAALADQSAHKVTLDKIAPIAQTDQTVAFTLSVAPFKGVTGAMSVTVTTSDSKSGSGASLTVTGPK